LTQAKPLRAFSLPDFLRSTDLPSQRPILCSKDVKVGMLGLQHYLETTRSAPFLRFADLASQLSIGATEKRGMDKERPNNLSIDQNNLHFFAGAS